jgi:hypothetical protein
MVIATYELPLAAGVSFSSQVQDANLEGQE